MTSRPAAQAKKCFVFFYQKRQNNLILPNSFLLGASTVRITLSKEAASRISPALSLKAARGRTETAFLSWNGLVSEKAPLRYTCRPSEVCISCHIFKQIVRLYFLIIFREINLPHWQRIAGLGPAERLRISRFCPSSISSFLPAATEAAPTRIREGPFQSIRPLHTQNELLFFDAKCRKLPESPPLCLPAKIKFVLSFRKCKRHHDPNMDKTNAKMKRRRFFIFGGFFGN